MYIIFLYPVHFSPVHTVHTKDNPYIQLTCVHRTVTKSIKFTPYTVYIYISIEGSTPHFVRYKTQEIVLSYHIRFSSTFPTRPLVLYSNPWNMKEELGRAGQDLNQGYIFLRTFATGEPDPTIPAPSHSVNYNPNLHSQ